MRKITFKNILFITICSTLIIPSCLGQSPTKAEKIDEILTMLHEQSQFNGNIMVAEKGQVILNKSYGLQNESTRTKLNENSIFDLASVSKQFTAMAIVILKEQNKVSYNDDIRKHIPELGHYKGITIRHLLNHTSGLPDYMSLLRKKWDKTKVATNTDIVKVFQTYKPNVLFPPGDKFRYSNTGYALLANVVEKASGTTYRNFLRKHIFKPLKMKHTFVHNRQPSPRSISSLAIGSTLSDTSDKKILVDISKSASRFYYLGGIVGDGSIHSTVVDLLKWDRGLYKKKLVSSDSIKEIYSPSRTNDGKTNQYGFGWRIRSDPGYGRILNHSGSWAGFRTFIERHIETGKTIIILQNFSQAVLPIRNIREILYDQPITKIFRREIKIKRELLAEYAGDYVTKSDPKSIISISKGESYIIYNATEQKWNMKFYPETETSFFSKNQRFNIQIKFVVRANGRHDIALYQNNKVIEEGLKRK